MRGSAPPQPAPTHAQTVSTDRSEGAVRAQLYARVSVVAECVAKAASVELGEEPNCSPASNISLERRNPHKIKLHPGSRRVRGSGAWAAFAVGGLVEVMHAYDKTLPSIDALDLAKRQLFPHFSDSTLPSPLFFLTSSSEPGAQVLEPLHLTPALRAPPDAHLHSLLSFFVFLSVLP